MSTAIAIQIKIINPPGIIDDNTVYVRDVGASRDLDFDGTEYTSGGNVVEINYRSVGDVEPGGSKTYDIYFKLSDIEVDNWVFDPLVNLNGVKITYASFLFIFGAILCGLGIMYMFIDGGKESESKSSKGGFLLLLGTILIVLYGLIWMGYKLIYT